MSRRKNLIYGILHELGGKATTREIAEKLGGWSVNGVSQTLGVWTFEAKEVKYGKNVNRVVEKCNDGVQ